MLPKVGRYRPSSARGYEHRRTPGCAKVRFAAATTRFAAAVAPRDAAIVQTRTVTTRMPLARPLLPFAAAFWTVFGLVAGILVWLSMLTHGHNVPWLLAYHLLVWLAWLVPTCVIVRLARRFPVLPARASSILVHVLAATATALLHSLYGIMLMVWMRPYDRRTAGLSDLEIGKILLSQLPLEWLLYCVVLGAVLAFEFYRRYVERALIAEQLERSLADARLHALELQLQPHFLFNTLNAIAGLVRNGRGGEAVAMIAGLAELLRYSLDHAGRQRVPLCEEIAMVERYLEIESARFPDRMSFRLHVDDEARRAAVPILILQPLAENAVRHGIARTDAPGSIELEASRVGERLHIRMRNDGRLDAARSDGIGLKNTRERLAHLYGGAGHFRLSEHAGGVLAILDLPWTAAA
jgi:hypothetical protein